MIDSVEARARIAVRIGSSIATTVPKVSVRITIAAMIPISSLVSVDGVDTFWPELAAGLHLDPGRLGGLGRRVDDRLGIILRQLPRD